MKLIVADDSALFREGLVGLLGRRGHEVVAQASSATELVDVSREISADVLITDVRMPPSMTDDGLKAAVQLRREFPQMGILVLSQYIAPAYARELFYPTDGAAPHTLEDPPGGLGYLLKDRVSRVADFVRNLEVVGSGGVVIDPDVAMQLMRNEESQLSELTEREMEILALMAKGYSNTQLAEELFLTGATVSKHVANIFLKLGMQPGEENRRVRAVLAYLADQQR